MQGMFDLSANSGESGGEGLGANINMENMPKIISREYVKNKH